MVSDKGSSASCLKIILPPTGYVNVAEIMKFMNQHCTMISLLRLNIFY